MTLCHKLFCFNTNFRFTYFDPQPGVTILGCNNIFNTYKYTNVSLITYLKYQAIDMNKIQYIEIQICDDDSLMKKCRHFDSDGTFIRVNRFA